MDEIVQQNVAKHYVPRIEVYRMVKETVAYCYHRYGSKCRYGLENGKYCGYDVDPLLETEVQGSAKR